jgi:glutaredoxin 3
MDVKVYSTQTCTWCKRAKDYLRKHSIEFTEINVSGNQQASQEMMKKSGQMGVPVIEVDGKVIVGYDEDELKKALNL